MRHPVVSSRIIRARDTGLEVGLGANEYNLVCRDFIIKFVLVEY